MAGAVTSITNIYSLITIHSTAALYKIVIYTVLRKENNKLQECYSYSKRHRNINIYSDIYLHTHLNAFYINVSFAKLN